MLNRINSIRNFGLLFRNFQWCKSAPDFKSVNVIYGWNGSGKTTLTRFFNLIREGSNRDVEFSVNVNHGVDLINQTSFVHPVRVFNEDYVNDNIDILESKTRSISVLLGKENTTIFKEILDLEEQLNGKDGDPSREGEIKRLNDLAREISDLNKDQDKTFTDIARDIASSQNASNVATRNYKRPQAKADFYRLQDPKTLSDTEFDAKKGELNQEVRKKISTRFEDGQQMSVLIRWISTICDTSKSLGEKTTSSQIIARLKNFPMIADWVEVGLELHKEHHSKNCEYCGAQISPHRYASLVAHFNDEDRSLKEEIDRAIEEIEENIDYIRSITVPDANSFYPELYERAMEMTNRLSRVKHDLVSKLDVLKEFLQKKRHATTVKMECELEVSNASLVDLINDTISLVNKHNEKTLNFEQVKESATEELKRHYLSSIRDSVDARQLKIKHLECDRDALENGIREIRKELENLYDKIHSDHRAARDLTKSLHAFLGRTELQFEVIQSSGAQQGSSALGYSLLRQGRPARSLSTGEKTAIAFVYFLVHLEDGYFDKSNGVVVIDDPVSSLDSTSMYQAFAFLKNGIRGCKQSFIFTHNFEFLRLLVQWIKHSESKSSLYMIKNEIVLNKRVAILDALDPTLIQFETEYQYLFKCLKGLQSNQNNTVEMAYPVPNVARKLWESFLNFHIPNNKNIYKKNELLKEGGVDAQKLDAVYKFTNDQSHVTGSGLNPSLVPEALNAINNIFELMQEIAPQHYQVLENVVDSC